VFVSIGEEAHPMGLDQGRDEKLCVAQTGAARTDRVHRMDADGHMRHSKFVGLREDKKAREIIHVS
jgi:hypothetical protein